MSTGVDRLTTPCASFLSLPDLIGWHCRKLPRASSQDALARHQLDFRERLAGLLQTCMCVCVLGGWPFWVSLKGKPKGQKEAARFGGAHTPNERGKSAEIQSQQSAYEASLVYAPGSPTQMETARPEFHLRIHSVR